MIRFRFWLSGLFLSLAALTIPPGRSRVRFYEMIESLGADDWFCEIETFDADFFGHSR